MVDFKLRQAIAAEAARLLHQGKETDFFLARRKAAKWACRDRIHANDLPSQTEIQQQYTALASLSCTSRQTSALVEMRLVARELLELLENFSPRVASETVQGPVLPGAEIEVRIDGDLESLTAVLHDAGHHPRLIASQDDDTAGWQLRFHFGFPCRVVEASTFYQDENELDLADLDELLNDTPVPIPEAEIDTCLDEDDDYHPDAFPTMRMVLQGLERIFGDPREHPQGDLLYHSLQVFELAVEARPYDEEFLLACLLHDAGLALDRRHPMEAAWNTLGPLITARTWFFIENRAEAVDYLKTGKIRGTLRKSEDFEELVLLAKFDLAGRKRGVKVRDLDEALDFIAGLSTAWDDV